MAIFRIDNKYVFNDSTKEIKKLYSNKKLKLTFMRAQCLSYILSHAEDEIISKHSVSQVLWGEKSPFTSDASLTQALYLIRRDLKTIGIDDLFLTVPKLGVAVNKESLIEVLCDKPGKTRFKKTLSYIIFIAVFMLMTAGLAVFT
ncbi:transcriptional regulator [Buttiauxella gaviniae]|uniref:Transcriptional regulator n=1 Tax=Buttiauxella gaviniae TaxID=82990 RepID=A0ABV3NRJ6_9ENTR